MNRLLVKSFGVAGAISVAALTISVTNAGATTHHAVSSTKVAQATFPKPPASLIKKADAEGEVVVDLGATDALTEAALEKFSDAYPGIKTVVDEVANGTAEAAISASAQAGNQPIDALLSAYDGFFGNAYNKGYTISANKLIPGFRVDYPKKYQEANGTTGIVYWHANGFMYNTNLVPAADAPTSITSFENPIWKGHIAAITPNISSSYAEFDYAIQKKYGDKALQEIGANMIKSPVYTSQNTAANAVAAGAAWATIDLAYSNVPVLVAANAPIKYVQPALASGAAFALAVLKGSPHPYAAQLLAYWLYSKKGAGTMAAVSAEGGGDPWLGGGKNFIFPNPSAYLTSNLQTLDSLLGLPQP